MAAGATMPDVKAKRSPGRPRYGDILTPAEWKTLQMLRHGLSNAAIARLRGVSRYAVRFHLQNLRGKLQINDRRTLRLWRGAPAASLINQKETKKMSALNLGPIGQISRQVSDIAAAEAWYRDVLGLPHIFTFGQLAFFDCAGTRLFLSNEASEKPGEQNVIYFRVADIDAAFDELTNRGVTFEGAPHMIFKHPTGMEEWMAFFRDPDGGLLALMSQVAP